MAAANEIISTFGDNRSIFYFDLASKMTPEGDGWKGVGRDHLHLTPEGYELWAAAMEPLLSKLLSG
jgi:N-acetylglucosamine-6-sulfatase